MITLRIGNKIIKDVGLVVFDKDGTLIDIHHYWYSMVALRVDLVQKKLCFEDTFKKDIMSSVGIDIRNKKLRGDGPVGIQRREIVLQTMADALARIGYPDTYDGCYEAFQEADRLSVDLLPEIIKPIPGMHALIDALYSNGCKIAIATTDKSERARLASKTLHIADKVDFIVGDDMVEHSKPAPDMLNMILDKIGTQKENGVMVGDTLGDVIMGINAGLKASIAVCSGLTPREELLKGTKYVVRDISLIVVQ